MSISYLIYSSRPFGFDTAALNAILLTARRNNARDGITGALIVRHDLYLQWLEGPKDALVALFRRITSDDRHLDIVQHDAGDAPTRAFAAWAMRDDPAASWMWSPAEVENDALRTATPGDIRAIFARLSADNRDLDDVA